MLILSDGKRRLSWNPPPSLKEWIFLSDSEDMTLPRTRVFVCSYYCEWRSYLILYTWNARRQTRRLYFAQLKYLLREILNISLCYRIQCIVSFDLWIVYQDESIYFLYKTLKHILVIFLNLSVTFFPQSSSILYHYWYLKRFNITTKRFCFDVSKGFIIQKTLLSWKD